MDLFNLVIILFVVCYAAVICWLIVGMLPLVPAVLFCCAVGFITIAGTWWIFSA